MDSTDVLNALRLELVDVGVVREPNVLGDAPPFFLEPESGAPAPGERDAPENDDLLVVSAFLDVELGAGPFEAGRRTFTILLRYRSRTTAGLIAARRLDSAIRAVIVDRPDGGLGWVMGDPDAPVLVLSSTVMGGLGRIGETEDGVLDQAARYAFEVLA